MKVGIITYHSSHNYGSMLQAYALSHFLISRGYDVEIIDFRSPKQLRLYKHPLRPRSFAFNKRYFKGLLYPYANPVWLFNECRKWSVYEKFVKDYLPVTKKRYNSWESVLSDLNVLQYNVLISGGDQIWNMRGLHFDKAYYLDGKLDGIKKISYSTSFGGVFLNKIEKDEQEYIKNTLSDYSSISVREVSMKNYLEPLLNMKVEVVVDPTLLLQVDDYDALIKDDPIVKGQYILYYSPFPNSKAENLAIMYGKYKELKVVTTFPHIINNKGMTAIHKSGPSEFLNLLKNAAMVIGRSFHLIVFSLLYHKDFIAIDGAEDARMKDILMRVGLIDRGRVDVNNFDKIVLPPIDIKKIDDYFFQLRRESEDYLLNTLVL